MDKFIDRRTKELDEIMQREDKTNLERDMALHFLGTAGLGYVKGYLGAMKLIILSVVLSVVCGVILALLE